MEIRLTLESIVQTKHLGHTPLRCMSTTGTLTFRSCSKRSWRDNFSSTQKRMNSIPLIVLIFVILRVVFSSERSFEFRAIHGHDVAAEKPTINVFLGRSKIDCITRCLASSDCGGFNYRRLETRIVQCDLKRGMTFRNRIRSKNGTTYYEKAGIWWYIIEQIYLNQMYQSSWWLLGSCWVFGGILLDGCWTIIGWFLPQSVRTI